MTQLQNLIQFNNRPKPKKSVYLNKKEKIVKRDLAGMLGLSSFRGYKNWEFLYQHDDDVIQYDNVNELVKDLCAGKIPTDHSYYVTAELSFDQFGDCAVLTHIDLSKCLGGK